LGDRRRWEHVTGDPRYERPLQTFRSTLCRYLIRELGGIVT
jgi:hypothetical protein